MKPEKQRLIHELLDDEARRHGHWLAGVRTLRRRRYWRVARRGLALSLALAFAALWLEQPRRNRPRQQASLPAKTLPAGVPQPSLSDDQLLALFPDTPIALATLADGKKRLIFLRPEDAKRFIGYP